jgi:beta-galactosidase
MDSFMVLKAFQLQKTRLFLALFFTVATLGVGNAQNNLRQEIRLKKGWQFAKGDYPGAMSENFDDKNWETVDVPHDWAIYGPFDRKYDLQKVAVQQNNETVATVKTGRTGGLPYIGIGWYR